MSERPPLTPQQQAEQQAVAAVVMRREYGPGLKWGSKPMGDPGRAHLNEVCQGRQVRPEDQTKVARITEVARQLREQDTAKLREREG